MEGKLQILASQYLQEYTVKTNMEWEGTIAGLQAKTSFSKDDFEHYLQASSVYSSNIEGNSLDFDAYLKNKRFNIKSKPKEMAEIDDLLAAYNYAVTHALTRQSFLESHKILSKTILSLKSQRGKLRNQPVGIFSGGRLEYMAVEAEYVVGEFNKLFDDIELLIKQELTWAEVFYYASMIHLVFEKIHPFMDGNGRAGRLLEKWFLASKMGQSAWGIPSEKYYELHRQDYYEHIHIGLNYYVLKWERCIPFLLMLAEAVK